MSELHPPHDEFFKSLMQDKTIAISYFQYFLPAPIVQHLNFDTLELDTNSYITESLKGRYSDMVFTCQYKNYPVDLPLLLEHKSTPSDYPHLQLLGYMLEIWQQRLDKKQGLRPILPIIFYHGEKRWHLRRLEEYFDWMDETLTPFIPHFDYILNDLSQHSKADLLQINFSFFVNALLALKYKGNFLILQQEVTFEAMNPAVLGTKLFHQLLIYVLGNTEAEAVAVKEFIEQLIESPKTGDIMTMYDQFLQLADSELQKNYQQLNRSLEIQKLKTKRAEKKAEEEKKKRETQKKKAEKEKLRAAQEKTRAEMEHQRFLNSVRVMLKSGLSPDFVATATGLELAFVQTLAQEINLSEA